MNNPLKKILITSTLLLLFIWALGPILSIKNFTPLANINLRIYLSIAIVIVDLCYIYWLERNKNITQNKITDTGKTNTDLTEEARERILSITKLLNKKTKKNADHSKIKSPWIITLGQSLSGKKSLLNQLEYQEITTPHPTNSLFDCITYWKKPTSICVNYDISPGKQDIKKNQAWHQTLLFLRDRFKKTPRTVFITLDIPSIHPSNEWDSLTDSLKIISQVFKKTPITILLTKCDKIIGFKEFYNALPLVQQRLLLGESVVSTGEYSTATKNIKRSLINIMSRFNNTISKHVSNTKSKNDGDFNLNEAPFQLKSILKQTLSIIGLFNTHVRNNIQSIYLLSALQDNKTCNINLMKHKQLISPLHEKIYDDDKSQQPLFTQGLLNQKVEKTITPSFHKNLRFITRNISLPYTTTCLFITAMLVFSWEKASTSIDKTYQMIQQGNIKTSDTKKINELDGYEKIIKNKEIINNIDKNHSQWYWWVGFPAMATLKKQTVNHNHIWQSTTFTPYLNNQLIDAMLSTKNDAFQKYNAFSTYLMLTHSIKPNVTVIKNWFNNTWLKQYNNQPETVSILNTLLDAYLIDPTLSIPTDTALINKIKINLKKISNEQLALLNLQNKYTLNPIAISEHIPGMNMQSLMIPALYTQSSLQAINNLQASDIASLITTSNPILGKLETDNITRLNASDLLSHIHSTYINNFRSEWRTKLLSLSTQTTLNLDSQIDLISQLVTNNSSLHKLISTMIVNANTGLSVTDQPIEKTKNFSNIVAFSDNSNIYATLYSSLNSLQQSLLSIKNASNPNKEAYQQLIKILSDKNNPYVVMDTYSANMNIPMKQWISSLSNDSWRSITKRAKSYINSKWTEQVLPLYQKTIYQRYPIFKNSQIDLSLTDLNQFFGPQGEIGHFFTQYLQPITDMDGHYWTWKSIGSHQIPFDQSTIELFIRASMIQQIFYTTNSKAASFKYGFTLQSLSDNAQAVNITNNNKTTQFIHNQPQSATYSWPDNHTSPISASFTLANNTESRAIKASGTWAFLRLLDQGLIRPTSDTNQYFFTLTIDQESASLGLVFENKINVLLPSVLNKFRCPDKL